MKAGRFFLPNDYVRSEQAHDLFEAMKFVPLRAELRAYSMEFDFIGLSPMFTEIEQGTFIPIYTIKADYDENDKIIVVVSIDPDNQ